MKIKRPAGQGQNTKVSRNEAVRELWFRGSFTLQEIGKIFKITRQRVFQIVKKGE